LHLVSGQANELAVEKHLAGGDFPSVDACLLFALKMDEHSKLCSVPKCGMAICRVRLVAAGKMLPGIHDLSAAGLIGFIIIASDDYAPPVLVLFQLDPVGCVS